VLKSAGYYLHALLVAEQAEQWEWTLEVLLDDMQSYDQALTFLDTLSRPEVAAALRRYGKLLITGVCWS
jgi:hypothetical protein